MVFALVLCTQPRKLLFVGAFLPEYIRVRLRLTNILPDPRIKADAIVQKSKMYSEKELNEAYSTRAIKGMYKCNQVHLLLLKRTYIQGYIPSLELSITFTKLPGRYKAG